MVEEVVNTDQIVEYYEAAKARFISENSWYEDDYKMTKRAGEIGAEYAKEYHDKYGHLPPPEETFNHMRESIKKEFPEQKPKRQTRVASTQNRTVATKPKKTKTLQDLPEDQRAIAKEVIESIPDMTEEDYLKNYVF